MKSYASIPLAAAHEEPDIFSTADDECPFPNCKNDCVTCRIVIMSLCFKNFQNTSRTIYISCRRYQEDIWQHGVVSSNLCSEM